MTITIAMLCDSCDNVFAPNEPAGNQKISILAHKAGWASTYKRGHWTNQCPDHTN